MPKRPSPHYSGRVSKRIRRSKVAQYEPETSSEVDETVPMDSDDEIQPLKSSSPAQQSKLPTNGVAHQSNGVQSQESEDDDFDSESGEENGNDELTHEEASAAVKLAQKNGHSLAGILQSVRLDRFMSHQCFQYELGPNVNIINGRNGSGKSAIVAALQIGLGARASATERAAKLEDHIMHGKDTALITIVIRNRRPPKDSRIMEADLTYKHDEYGDHIVIERRLMRKKGKGGATSNWAVRGARGKIVFPKGHTPAKEVKNIIFHFGFMVDNPVAILTQTKAKQFLAGKKPSHHYELFREATLLRPLEDELEETRKVHTQVERLLGNAKKMLPETERELEKLRLQYEEAQELKHIDKRIDEARALWAWTTVDEAKEEVDSLRNKLANELQPELQANERQHQNAQKKLDKLYDAQKKYETVASAEARKTQQAGDQLRNAQAQINRIGWELKRKCQSTITHKKEIEHNDQEITAQNNMKESARREHFAGQEQKSQILCQLEELTSREAELEKGIESLRVEERGMSEEKMQLEADYNRTHAERGRWIRHYEDKLREHRQAQIAIQRKTSLGRFGAVFDIIEEVIQQNLNSFEVRPVGPIGQYLTIEDESWARAIELCIGNRNICAYIVHSSRDAKKLKNLFDREKRARRLDGRNFWMPSVYIMDMKKQRYNVGPEYLPDLASHGYGELKTMLEMLKISHDTVFNALIDRAQIESVVLNHFDEDLQRLGWMQLPNVTSVWNKRGERAYTRNGSNVFRKAPPHGHARYLTKDMSGYIQDLEDQLNHSLSEKQRFETLYDDSKARLAEKDTQIRERNRDVKRKQTELFDSRRRRQPLQDQLEQAENAFDPTPYDQAIMHLQENISKEKVELDNTLREAQELEERKEEHEQEVSGAKEAFRIAKEEATRATNDLKQVMIDVKRTRSRASDLEKRKLESEATVAQANSALQERDQDILNQIEKANDFGERPNNVDHKSIPSDKLKKRVDGLKRRLENEQQRRGGLTAEQIEEQFLKGTRKFEDLNDSINRVESYEDALRKGIASRHKKHGELGKTSRKIVRTNFRRFLEVRGNSGNIMFKRNDDGEKELRISTKLKSHLMENGEVHETKELSALSGGEKSMTTLCFLLAMAEMCQNPLRVFDEIDVYQDDSSRRTSYRILVETCSKYLSNRQIILITPCSLPHMQETPSLKIVKMPDPRPAARDSMEQTHLTHMLSQGH